ncbi:exodeoxyribonuclease VII small subunit [Candidatus Saccharibacteria bacterium]|nr:exodeoxyribonuclease VII small subunit [Candidatus Saccharibacteria bacterium]MBR3254477.1 exodeoxyribonuclease VII small subunit [Candidatus Saccharibacteria bacterium]
MSEKKTINQKIEELDKSTEWFYSDDFNLDDAVKKYKEAIGLAKELQKDLDDLKNEVEILAEDFSK